MHSLLPKSSRSPFLSQQIRFLLGIAPVQPYRHSSLIPAAPGGLLPGQLPAAASGDWLGIDAMGNGMLALGSLFTRSSSNLRAQRHNRKRGAAAQALFSYGFICCNDKTIAIAQKHRCCLPICEGRAEAIHFCSQVLSVCVRGSFFCLRFFCEPCEKSRKKKNQCETTKFNAKIEKSLRNRTFQCIF